MTGRGLELPDFPWDRLAPYKARASEHPDGLADLSVGTPVDPTPPSVQAALAGSTNAPGYPTTHGTRELRVAAVEYLDRRFGVTGLDPDAVLPTVGSKEFVAWLPTLLGLGPGDTVIVPDTAYPTYAVGAQIAGCAVAPMSQLEQSTNVGLLWLNSPANPTGEIASVEQLAKAVAWAREHDVLVVSDECYLEFGWDRTPISVLRPEVCGDSRSGVLAVQSLSKRSNLAGYRAGFVTGDPACIAPLLEARKHAGMMLPRPIQDAMTAALRDDAHVDEQRSRYIERRAILRGAFTRAGFGIDHSEGSLYLWASRDESCWDSVRWCAERGILVAPGEFYGSRGAGHVRVAFTATDERVASTARRLGAE